MAYSLGVSHSVNGKVRRTAQNMKKSDTGMSIEEFSPNGLNNLQSSSTGHNLKLGKMYTMTNPSREILVDALNEFGSQLKDVPATSGGAGMDVAQITQWLLPQPKTVAFLGARAADEGGYTLRELSKRSRVGVRMEEVPKCRTGVLLVAHFKKTWCEIFFIDNMATINPSFIDKPIVTQVLERANMIYITELSVMLNKKIGQMLAYYSFSRFKHSLLIMHREQFMINSKDVLYEILSYVDIVFLTHQCAATLISFYGIPCCGKYRHASDIYLWLKSFARKSSVVIVSDGLMEAYIHTDMNNGMSSRYKSRFAKHCNLVDYYGAARAFVGGFMAMMIRGYQIDPCVECGFYCASVIVGKMGVQIPDDEAIVSKWYSILETILQRKGGEQEICKTESTMPFTMFQTPWKEKEVNAFLGASFNAPKKLKEPEKA